MGKHSEVGQMKLNKDTLKAFLKDFNTSTESCKQSLQYRAVWRGLLRKSGVECEDKRIREAELMCSAKTQTKTITNRAVSLRTLFPGCNRH